MRQKISTHVDGGMNDNGRENPHWRQRKFYKNVLIDNNLSRIYFISLFCFYLISDKTGQGHSKKLSNEKKLSWFSFNEVFVFMATKESVFKLSKVGSICYIIYPECERIQGGGYD